MSTSQELVLDLLGRGMSRRAIGDAIGRHNRTIYYVESGAKPGKNLAPALEALRARLDTGVPVASPAARQPLTTAPARRVTSSGKVARVRKPATITGSGWSSTTLRKQSTRHGARGAVHPLAAAAARGETVAVTVSVNSRATVNSSSGGRKRGAGGVDMELGDAADVLDALAESGGDFAAYVMGELMAAGHISVSGDPAAAADSIELRSY